MIQFSKINQPDLSSGYTVDDNARALISMVQHYEWAGDAADIPLITTYLNFIKYCQQPKGNFLNYVDSEKQFTSQNEDVNLDDANGRTIWALGFVLSKSAVLPPNIVTEARRILIQALLPLNAIHSPRAMAFIIKGLHFANKEIHSSVIRLLIDTLASRLMDKYRHEATADWAWFEGYLTYANSVLPEAMLYAYMETGNVAYQKIAKSSFDFLLSMTFRDEQIKVVSNQGWHFKGETPNQFGEQAIDVAYTILALDWFYHVYKEPAYLEKMEIAFDWFLGKNHLNQIVYNPCTGGCYDGLEETHLNLNQGAESTVSYLMSRLTVEKHAIPPLKATNYKLQAC